MSFVVPNMENVYTKNKCASMALLHEEDNHNHEDT